MRPKNDVVMVADARIMMTITRRVDRVAGIASTAPTTGRKVAIEREAVIVHLIIARTTASAVQGREDPNPKEVIPLADTRTRATGVEEVVSRGRELKISLTGIGTTSVTGVDIRNRNAAMNQTTAVTEAGGIEPATKLHRGLVMTKPRAGANRMLAVKVHIGAAARVATFDPMSEFGKT